MSQRTIVELPYSPIPISWMIARAETQLARGNHEAALIELRRLCELFDIPITEQEDDS